jgi:hypothetical protein
MSPALIFPVKVRRRNIMVAHWQQALSQPPAQLIASGIQQGCHAEEKCNPS